jgi:fructokinase
MMATPWALGIDLGGTKIHAAVLGPDGTTHWEQRVPTPAGDYGATLQALAGLVRAARAAVGGDEVTVGIGGPGAVAANGLMKNANSTCLNGRAFIADATAAIGQPVRFANDANCLALSEAVDGAGFGASVVFAVILGTGTGAGIVTHGRLLTGPHRLAGEWGHNPLPWPQPEDDAAPVCWCGQTGCIETWLSGPGMALDHRRHTGLASSAETIAALAVQGDAACRATLDRHARRLARALASVINVLDPDVIVLAGGLSKMSHLYTQVPSLWSSWIFSGGVADPASTRLLPARHGDASGVRGAAWLWHEPSGASSSRSAVHPADGAIHHLTSDQGRLRP